MSKTEQIQQDLDYIASTMRRHEKPVGEPVIFFLWAFIVPVGFALADFAPQYAGPFWFVCGIGGGLLSMWLGARGERLRGVRDVELGKRYGLHWGIGGAAFILSGLPMITGRIPPQDGATNFLLVAGLLYALAGVHLQRGILWSGLMMFAAYAALVLFQPPYTWTITGVAIAIAMIWSGISAQNAIKQGAPA